MNRFLKYLVIVLGGIYLVNIFGPREPVDWTIYFSESEIGDDPDAYLAAREANFDDIMPGAEKEIIWAGAKGAKKE